MVPKKERKNDNKGDAGENHEEGVVILERSEGRSVVSYVHEIEEIVNHRELRILRTNIFPDQVFCDLV